MAANRMVENQRPTKRPQVRTQRPDERGNPDFSGEPWGSESWPDDWVTDSANNLTQEIWGTYVNVAPYEKAGQRFVQIALYDSLAELQADGTYGDGNLAYNSGADFTAGQYVVLRDNSLANYATSAWSAGAHV